jgi:hypothetical protein
MLKVTHDMLGKMKQLPASIILSAKSSRPGLLKALASRG